MRNRFEIEDLIRIAKRENNSKRSYLYVNPIQGKHIPVSPSLSLELFEQLVQKVEKRYGDESVMIIGFAETATAIGTAIAYKAKNCKYYLNTTREDISDVEYLFFTESHSHATEQRLVINGMEQCLKTIDRIVFAEDEVTTGKTIEKLIRILQEKYARNNIRFGIVSILNSMPDQRIEKLENEGIICDFLHRIPVQYRVEEINNHNYEPLRMDPLMNTSINVNSIHINNYWNSRIISTVDNIKSCVDSFVGNTIAEIQLNAQEQNILILGTEECMFPGMLIGSFLESKYPDKIVRFHATTRSPIEVCADEDYPLHNRMPLESIYGDGRRTFIYNLTRYDRVFIVTDAPNLNQAGLKSICASLEYYGNSRITLIRWGDNGNAK